jgi:hypothetical protein
VSEVAWVLNSYRSNLLQLVPPGECGHYGRAATRMVYENSSPIHFQRPPIISGYRESLSCKRSTQSVSRIMISAVTYSSSAGIQASLDLRRHLSSRTNTMLVPLNRYLNTLIPSPTERTSNSGCRRLKPFSTADFFSSLKANGSPLPFKSATKRKEFYERWLKTPAFGLWLAQQEEVVHRTLQDKWAG